MFLRLEGNVPPLPWNEKVGSQVNVTFWFWMMYPPQNKKVGFQVKVTFVVLDNVVGFQVKVTFFVLDNVPPPPQE